MKTHPTNLIQLPERPAEATAVRITPSTHHLNMESEEEGRMEGEMMVVRDIPSTT